MGEDIVDLWSSAAAPPRPTWSLRPEPRRLRLPPRHCTRVGSVAWQRGSGVPRAPTTNPADQRHRRAAIRPPVFEDGRSFPRGSAEGHRVRQIAPRIRCCSSERSSGGGAGRSVNALPRDRLSSRTAVQPLANPCGTLGLSGGIRRRHSRMVSAGSRSFSGGRSGRCSPMRCSAGSRPWFYRRVLLLGAWEQGSMIRRELWMVQSELESAILPRSNRRGGNGAD